MERNEQLTGARRSLEAADIPSEWRIARRDCPTCPLEREATIDSLTHLESYYQSKYEYYLAMATEAKENKERVGLLLLDLDRDESIPDNLVESKRTTCGQALCHGSQHPFAVIISRIKSS